jgi:hypothetical protein
MLTALSLEAAWPDLASFERPGYRRILVPVFEAASGSERSDGRRLQTVANLYAAAEAGPDADAGT